MIYSDEFKQELLIEERTERPNVTIEQITDALCNDRVQLSIKSKGAEILLKELKEKHSP